MPKFLIYDVFTDKAFGGNPLAIFPNAEHLDESQLQQIAREFNFSETSFVYPPETPEGTARVRIFTPTQEIPFAGHPTVGTAMALLDLGVAKRSMVLELGVGALPVTVDGTVAAFVTRHPLQTWSAPPAEIIASCVQLEEQSINSGTHTPIIASVGLPFAIAEVVDEEALAGARPSSEAFDELRGYWPTKSHFDLLLYVRDGNSVKARMFAPLDGIPEDPATGSAAAALAALICQIEDQPIELSISQGAEMNRPSHIGAKARFDEANELVVTISGQAIKVAEGRLTV